MHSTDEEAAFNDDPIEAFGENNQKLTVEDTILTPNRREFKVHFPQPLETADQMKYRVQFEVQNGFQGNYYDIAARAITRKISFSLFSPNNIRFNSHRVEQESADGFISSAPPLVSLALEDGREKLSWQYRHPKPGDQFRTYWSLDRS